eukprot:8618854-Alexandrium_andersonii.AAC.1
MSASLVGSEMCIRDSCTAERLLSKGPWLSTTDGRTYSAAARRYVSDCRSARTSRMLPASAA